MQVFPAWAGVILKIGRKQCDEISVPRVGGGDPSIVPVLFALRLCSPRGRG